MILVVQMGARRNYELPRMLASRDRLAGLVTSWSWTPTRPPPRILLRLFPGQAGAFERRTIRGIPECLVRNSRAPEIASMFLRFLGAGPGIRYEMADRLLGRAARRAGLSGAQTVLTTGGNGGLNYLRWAREQGTRVAVDVFIHPRVRRILAEEGSKWSPRDFRSEFLAERCEDDWREILSLADFILCPSQFVMDGVIELVPNRADRLHLLPYSLGSVRSGVNLPVPRRVLFVGGNPVRKGLRYLAQAARRLLPLGYQVRVAGISAHRVCNIPELAGPVYLGRLSQEEIAREFASADIFCLPSLAEGQARAVLEAMAWGLPCIVTPGAGSPIVDGVSGIVTPPCDGMAIESAVREICEDPAKRTRMSNASRVTVREHDPCRIAERLVNILSDSGTG